MAKSHEIARTGKALKLSADKIVMLPVSEVRPYEKNPRKNADAVKFVKASIEQFGFKVPIVIDSNRVIICGHTRLEAAKSLGMAEVPCIVADDLTDAQVKALRLADNKVAEFSEWEMNLLGEELGELAEISDIDMGDFGFDLTEFDNIGMDAEEKEVVEDEVPEEVEPVCKKGEVWQLGEHRLMCGDSTDADAVAKLMNGERADIAFTSPPYNMAVTQISDKCPNRAMHNGQAYNSYDDNKSDSDYTKLLEGALKNCLDHADDVMFNIGILKASKIGIISMMSDFRDNFCDIIVWNKSQSMPLGLPSHAGCVSHRCELIFCFNQDGSRAFSHPQWSHGAQINRIDTENASNNEFAKVHAATFPVALPAKVIESYTEKSVLDVFGGTGTTMIAAEQLGRKCFMMELDPHYCDVIIARWEKLTGQKAVKVED